MTGHRFSTKPNTGRRVCVNCGRACRTTKDICLWCGKSLTKREA